MTLTADQPEMRRLDFLVFSDDWGEHPSSCQHIFRHIAKDHRVLWVNTIGMRNATFTLRDFRKVARKGRKMFAMRQNSAIDSQHNRNVMVSQPMMLPWIRSPMVRAFNSRSVTRAVQSLLQRMQFDNPVVVTTVPNAEEYPDLLVGRKVIYYCVDDFSLWPGIDAGIVREMESRLITRADCLIGVSNVICERLKASGKPTHMITHGVDVEIFSTVAECEHLVLNGIKKPRAGFFGLIDGRMDWDLIVSLAGKMPDVSFILAGPVDASAGKLPELENLHFVGAVQYAELPKLISGLDVLILPYRTGALADSLSPLKLKEYLASGRPVISANIGDTADWVDMISIARTPAEWVTTIQEILSGPDKRMDRARSCLGAHSWGSKAEELLTKCLSVSEITPDSSVIE